MSGIQLLFIITENWVVQPLYSQNIVTCLDIPKLHKNH